MKSDIEIKDFIYTYIKGSALELAVAANGGALYRDRRPSDSGKEDVLISVQDEPNGQNGVNGQIQRAVIHVNIYVSDVSRGVDKIENTSRLRTLSRIAIELLETYNDGECRFTIEKQTCFKVDGADEHCINNKLKLEITNF